MFSLRTLSYQARKALSKANFVKENVHYLVERVNDTYVQFETLKDEINNLPPSREGTVYLMTHYQNIYQFPLKRKHLVKCREILMVVPCALLTFVTWEVIV